METAYAAAGVTRFAAWVHECDRAMRSDLQRRGYTVAETTRAMGMALDDIRVAQTRVDLAATAWADYLRIFGLPPGLLGGGDHAAFQVAVAQLKGDRVATAMAFDHRCDRGIYNVGTLRRARRRGLATALTAYLLHDARRRGCRTASVQSTAMAEGVYAAVGFKDLGRILEFAPPPSTGFERLIAAG
jgi:GNAT superfamily N-acetyltransferase